jgi:hypothetical protein
MRAAHSAVVPIGPRHNHRKTEAGNGAADVSTGADQAA